MLKSIQIDSCNLTRFDPNIFQNLCDLEQVHLSNNIGLNLWMKTDSVSNEVNMKTEPPPTKNTALLNPTETISSSTTATLSMSTNFSSHASPISASTSSIASTIATTPASPSATKLNAAPSTAEPTFSTFTTTAYPDITFQPVCSSYNVSLLNLSGNDLKGINLSIFPFIEELKELNLEDNSLQNSINMSLQDIGLVSMETINLAYNAIPEIFSDMFINLPNLSNINISHNSISDPFLNLTGTPTIKILDLSYNNIKYLSVEFLQELDSIHELYLSHNQMIAITATIQYFYIFCPQMTIVDLSFNPAT